MDPSREPSPAPKPPKPPKGAPPALSPRGRRVRAIVFGTYSAFATAFVLLSTAQIITQVFGLGAAPLTASAPAPGASASACADGIRGLATALDRGVAASSTARTEADALAHMRAGMSPEWDHENTVAAACAADSRGAGAWAALLRLRRAEEGVAGRRVADVASVRRDVEAYVGPSSAPGPVAPVTRPRDAPP